MERQKHSNRAAKLYHWSWWLLIIVDLDKLEVDLSWIKENSYILTITGSLLLEVSECFSRFTVSETKSNPLPPLLHSTYSWFTSACGCNALFKVIYYYYIIIIAYCANLLQRVHTSTDKLQLIKKNWCNWCSASLGLYCDLSGLLDSSWMELVWVWHQLVYNIAIGAWSWTL